MTRRHYNFPLNEYIRINLFDFYKFLTRCLGLLEIIFLNCSTCQLDFMTLSINCLSFQFNQLKVGGLWWTQFVFSLQHCTLLL